MSKHTCHTEREERVVVATHKRNVLPNWRVVRAGSFLSRFDGTSFWVIEIRFFLVVDFETGKIKGVTRYFSCVSRDGALQLVGSMHEGHKFSSKEAAEIRAKALVMLGLLST